jgi:putative thioredoxin
MVDVTDQTFQSEVVERSKTTPVVVDLWAPWCGPCKTLGPILEKVVGETNGAVLLAKVNVDENPSVSQAFRVQSIPAVFAVVDGQVADSFVGALPEADVRAFVAKLAPVGVSELDELLARGDEASLRRALELDANDGRVGAALAQVLLESGRSEEASTLLEKYPETGPIARTKARLRLAQAELAGLSDDEVVAALEALLNEVKDDPEARQRYVDLLSLLDIDDPRVRHYRQRLTSRLF